MTYSTARKLYPCSTTGCAALLVIPGRCRTCALQIDALDRIAAARAQPSPKRSAGGYFRGVMTFVALGVLVYVLFDFLVLLADWIAGGK